MASHQPKEIAIKIGEELMRGAYANTLLVAHSAEEFVLDFVLSLPPQPVCTARVIVSPGHLKRIVGALRENLARYEKVHGPVREIAEPDGKRIGFEN